MKTNPKTKRVTHPAKIARTRVRQPVRRVSPSGMASLVSPLGIAPQPKANEVRSRRLTSHPASHGRLLTAALAVGLGLLWIVVFFACLQIVIGR